ncbi:hypothetical protein [Natronospora cellulosivora (SeqCode)]
MVDNLEVHLYDYESICYHGHTQKIINNILKKRTFNSSKKEWEWLGDGVYFFEKYYSHARNWCEKARRYNNWSIIKVNIKTIKMLDMIDPDNFDELKKFTSKIRDRYRELGGIRKVNTKLIFNMAYSKEKYDAVRHAFSVGKHKECIDPTKMEKMEIQVCVRNQECIFILEEVVNNEC